MQLTKNFSLEELTISQEAARNGLRNQPTQSQLAALKELCEIILQPLRDRVNQPVVVTSGFRSPTINRRVGGAVKSQHCKGQAADIMVPGLRVVEVVNIIRAMALPFDQLCDEYGQWVHVSYSSRHRRQVLQARYVNGKTEYRPK